MNGDKCQFRLTKPTVFGHELTSTGTNPDEKKVAAIRDGRPPKDESEVRSFMGLVQYSATVHARRSIHSQAHRGVDQEGRYVQVGGGTAEIISRVEAADYTSRDNGLLSKGMQDKNCC